MDDDEVEKRPIEVVKSFTLLTVKVLTDSAGVEHIVLDHGDFKPNPMTIEAIPGSEIIGRRITSIWHNDGKIVLGLSTKE